jgi:hypothetical protein
MKSFRHFVNITNVPKPPRMKALAEQLGNKVRSDPALAYAAKENTSSLAFISFVAFTVASALILRKSILSIVES